MTAWSSEDGRWRVRRIMLDGRQLWRIEHHGMYVPGLGAVLHASGCGRTGPVQTGAGWWLIADAATEEEVLRCVPDFRSSTGIR